MKLQRYNVECCNEDESGEFCLYSDIDENVKETIKKLLKISSQSGNWKVMSVDLCIELLNSIIDNSFTM